MMKQDRRALDVKGKAFLRGLKQTRPPKRLKAAKAALRAKKRELDILLEERDEDLAALGAKEGERDILLEGRDEALAANEAGKLLVARFLEADRNNNWGDEEALKGDIEAFLMNGGAAGHGGHV